MKLGIDAGAYSIELVLLDDQDRTVEKKSRPHGNKVKQVAEELLEEMDLPESFLLSLTGSMSHLLNDRDLYRVGSQDALVAGKHMLASKAQSMIYLGAQRTYYIKEDESGRCEIRRNSNCSAGTGAFFEEQAGRLQIPLELISETLKTAETVVPIAGRCSVFSKTDMIHRMQEGAQTPDILLGLCYAMVRNYKSNILHNRDVAKPVLLAGGVMKNAGVVRALKELFHLKEEDILSDENAEFAGAFGAASLAKNEIEREALLAGVRAESEAANGSFLPPLAQFERQEDSPEFILFPWQAGEETFLGIDVGSTSINLVLLNAKRQVLYYSYVKTLGRPLDIVKEELKKLYAEFPELESPKIAVTGSGREFIGKEIGAGLVINEISAQTEGALMSHPDTDTVFEIGGQDSKYMQAREGRMTDFEMNKVCAAGTGAFLEEQIKKLGISMEEFLTLAQQAQHPCELGNRCTVFIEGSVNRALAEGHPMEDVCAGLAYAIASNYLNRVVNRKEIGDHIALQGGIAYNKAVLCAFRSITGKEVHVSPYFSVTGAMGAASLLIDHSQPEFDREKNRQLNARLRAQSEASYLQDYTAPKKTPGRPLVGIPRVVFLHKMFPLFYTMFRDLGYDVILSPLTDREIVEKANTYVTAEVCYPIKLIYGHIAWLLEQKVDYIVLPRLYTIKHEGSVARKDYACMYMQTSPLLMEEAFHLKERGVTLIMPELSLQFGKKFMVKSLLSIGDVIGVPKPRMLPAAVKGFAALSAHSDRLVQLGRENLEGEEPVFVLISRVYNIIDPILNMGIEKHLDELGCRVVHLEHLEANYMNVVHDYKDMYWPFGQHILTGLKIIKAHKNFYPIYITNHGCGPDTAIQHFFQNELKDREYLQLEVDEHASGVGIITRLEAFLYALRPQNEISLEAQETANVRREEAEAGKAEKILIPDFGIYTDLIAGCVSDGREIVYARPLTEHKTFNFAMNKEYYTMLVMLEELLNAVESGSSYDLVCPVDEGSEVFGQYGLLCQKELKKRGYDVRLKAFYLEDLISRPDADRIYQSMIDAERAWVMELNAGKDKGQDQKKLLLLGEPLAVIKPYITGRQLEKDEKSQTACCIPMAFSEALLFHMLMVDRKKRYKKQLGSWKLLHDRAMSECGDTDLYTDMDRLFDATRGRFDFCVGDSARYRFAKLLCLSKEKTDTCYLIHSAEENAAIILKQLYEANRSKISVPYKLFDLDYEHGMNEE